MPVRKPHVSGTFYPADPAELQQFCAKYLIPVPSPVKARAVILPHAGYIYSGPTACKVLSRTAIPDRIFLIGPNHAGYGHKFSLMHRGKWETPLGSVSIDEDLADACLQASQDISPDPYAHSMEHSLEVEVPLLQFVNPRIRIVPLVIGTIDLELSAEVAKSLAAVLAKQKEPVLIVASTDMSHYESDSRTREKDKHALEAIQALDPMALIRAVRSFQISMCGFVPVYMLLMMTQALGIKKAELVHYTTSAETSGDYDRVVGYAGFILE